MITKNFQITGATGIKKIDDISGSDLTIYRNSILGATLSTDSNSNPTFKLPYSLKLSSQNAGTSESVFYQDAGSFGTWNGTNFGTAALTGYSVQEGATTMSRIGASSTGGATNIGASVFINAAPVNTVPRNATNQNRETTNSLIMGFTDNSATVGSSQFNEGIDFYFNHYQRWNSSSSIGGEQEYGLSCIKTGTTSGATSTGSRSQYRQFTFRYNEPTKAFGVSSAGLDKYNTNAWEMLPVQDGTDLYRVSYANMNMLNTNISLYDQHSLKFFSLQSNCNTTTFNAATGVNTATDIITVISTTGMVTGDKIWFSGLTATFAGGIQTDTDNRITSTDAYGILANKGTYWSGTYYVIVISSTTIQVSETLTDALNGLYIDLISTSTGTITVYYPKSVAIKAAATMTADYTFTLPATVPSLGQTLTTSDAAGTLTSKYYLVDQTYTPAQSTYSLNLNTVSFSTFYYERIGNKVTFGGQMTLRVTAAATNTFFGVTIPIASPGMSLASQGWGSGVSYQSTDTVCIVGDNTNKILQIQITSPSATLATGTKTFSVQGGYMIA